MATASRNGTAGSVKTIEIPEIQLRRIIVTIEGDTPLIVHRFGERAVAKIEDTQKRTPKAAKREARNPEQDFRDALYVIDAKEGRYGFPASGIKKSLVNAGGRFAGETMTVLRGVIHIEGELLEIKAPEPRMRTDVVRLSNGSADIRYRPEFWPWSMDVPVVFNALMMSEAQVVNLFQHAGFSIGIGDWRLESKNGKYGAFSVKDVQEVV